MSVPTTFPVWLSKPGAQDMFVVDLPGLNAAVAQGYSYGTVTPTTPKAAPMGVSSANVQIQVSPGQPNAVFDAISHGTRR